MNIGLFQVAPLTLAVFFICSTLTFSQELKPIKLLKPQINSGKLLMQALKDRQSLRSFSNKKLPVQVLSNLLWAAFGVNRPESGKRTAPSAMNWQEIDIYVALQEGLYLYDAKSLILNPILAEDIRLATGSQPFVKEAPLDLIYVSNLSRTGKATEEIKNFFATVDTGFISQNVYLFCASEGLATVVLETVDKPALAKKMGLRSEQKVILTQPVGYPKK